MTDEDRTAAKLKGYHCYIKFIDGEVMFLKVEGWDNEHERLEWITNTEKFLNGKADEDFYMVADLALNRMHIKYVNGI